MKNILVTILFMLATMGWAQTQQPSGQTAPPDSQTPAQTQPSPGSADQQAAPRGQTSTAPITEGCLGGTPPNYTITDNSGTAYKLYMPPNADTSKLVSHVGESVQVQGEVQNAGQPGNASINVQAIGRGMGKNCPGSSPGNTQPAPKQ